jgi:hypothetical protein
MFRVINTNQRETIFPSETRRGPCFYQNGQVEATLAPHNKQEKQPVKSRFLSSSFAEISSTISVFAWSLGFGPGHYYSGTFMLNFGRRRCLFMGIDPMTQHTGRALMR